jgi:hypothetical protein
MKKQHFTIILVVFSPISLSTFYVVYHSDIGEMNFTDRIGQFFENQNSGYATDRL